MLYNGTFQPVSVMRLLTLLCSFVFHFFVNVAVPFLDGQHVLLDAVTCNPAFVKML